MKYSELRSERYGAFDTTTIKAAHTHKKRPASTDVEGVASRRTTMRIGRAAGLMTLRLTTTAALILTLLTYWRLGLEPSRHTEVVRPRELHRYLFVAVPSISQSGADVCKTILSLQTLNYPTPDLIKWSDANGWIPGPKDLQDRLRTARTLEWLNTLPIESETGLAIILSEPGSWFQLRPEVLLKRYFDIAAPPIAPSTKGQAPRLQELIVFASQSTCAVDPVKRTPRSCPSESRMYLSDRIIIGPVRSLRALYHRAKERQFHSDGWDAVTTFDQIYAEQRILKAALAEGTKVSQHLVDVFTDFTMLIDPRPSISVSVNSTKQASPEKLFTKTKNLPADVIDSMTPYWSTSGQVEGLAHSASWKDVNLFADPASGEVPVVVHHEPSRQEQGKLSSEWWPHFWVHPHARAIMDIAQQIPTAIVARYKDQQGLENVFWSSARYEFNKIGVSTDHIAHEMLPWQDICSTADITAEVFRDDKPAWEPRTDYSSYELV